MNENKNHIPENVALQICEKIRENNSRKRFSLAKSQCWGCMKYSKKKGDFKHRCIFSDEKNRGCHIVNKIFDASY